MFRSKDSEREKERATCATSSPGNELKTAAARHNVVQRGRGWNNPAAKGATKGPRETAKKDRREEREREREGEQLIAAERCTSRSRYVIYD